MSGRTIWPDFEQDFGVVVFPGGNHTLQKHRVERDSEAVEFFRAHLVE